VHDKKTVGLIRRHSCSLLFL